MMSASTRVEQSDIGCVCRRRLSANDRSLFYQLLWRTSRIFGVASRVRKSQQRPS